MLEQVWEDIFVQFVWEVGSGICRSNIQQIHNAERRETIPIKLPEIVPGLGREKWGDHGARRATKEAPWDCFQHDAFRQAQVSLLGGYSVGHDSDLVQFS